MVTKEAPKAVKCTQCTYYFITHDLRFPYGCRTMGFKTQSLPETQIIAATGSRCVMFEPKSGPVQGERP